MIVSLLGLVRSSGVILLFSLKPLLFTGMLRYLILIAILVQSPLFPIHEKSGALAQETKQETSAGATAVIAQFPSTTSLSIEAENGMEWFRDKKQYVATGNVIMRRDTLKMRSELLKVFYAEQEISKKQQIQRIEAHENVVITNKGVRAEGDEVIYRMGNESIILKGDGLRLLTAEETLTARDSLEYWLVQNMAVARGQARITHEGNVITADLLRAFIVQHENEAREIETVEAEGGVYILTESEIIQGEKGTYDLETSEITLCGDVKITRG